MAFEPIPYAISGEQLSANMLRRQLYKQSYGQSGVSLPGDLKVTELPVPGTAVRIAAGGGTAKNLFPGGAGQSYDVTAPSVTDVPVSATGSSPATRELIVRIYDPQFAGSKPTDGVYVRPILVTALPTDYPFIWLATITQPANTGTILNSMIRDRRTLTSPRSLSEVISNNGGNTTLTSTAGQTWPSYAPSIAVPDWANWVHIIAHLSGFVQEKSLAEGRLNVRMGTTDMGGPLTLDYDGVTDGVRHTTVVTGSGPVPLQARGTSQIFSVWGRRVNVDSRPGRFLSDLNTHLAFDVKFSERIL